MGGYDLWSELTEKRNLLSACISELKKYGIERAKKEHEYKVALRKEVFTLHETDKVAWTACEKLAHGDTLRNEVARLRLERDLASTKYEVLMEKINGLKLEIRIIESQMSREWGNARG